MNEVLTPDGWGQVLRTQSARGMTSYLVKGAGFEGWYDGLQVSGAFDDDDPGEIDEDNDTVLPYPSRAQGPGWDGTTSTIQPNIDPHLEMGGASDSLTGEPTSESPVGADLDGLFEPHSRLAGARVHRLHFAGSDDPILDVTALSEESPTGLENSPINPDGVSTDDLFSETSPLDLQHQAATYDRLVIEDGLSFLKYADDDDDKKKNHHEQDGQSGFPKDDDDDDDDSSDSDDESDSDNGSSDSGDDDSSGGSDGSSSGGGHTAAAVAALTTTADLHFLANVCHCAEALPLHSKLEHRELQAEAAADVDGVTPQEQDLDKLLERYQQDNFNYQESNLDNLVDRSKDSGDGGELLNHYAKTAAPAAIDPGPTQIESQIEQLMQFWAVDNNGWWHWTGSQADLALLNQMQQQMMAVGMPGGPPGQMQAQSSFAIEANTPAPWREYLQTLASDRLVALAAWVDVVQKSKRLRAEGAITLEVFKPEVITAYIQGDHGRYYTTVQRLGSVPGAGRQLTSTQVSGWSCECEWGHWAWIRKRSFVGRMCSHAYALFSEMRSLDAKARRGKGQPLSASQYTGSVSANHKAAWTRTQQGGFEWVSADPTMPTAAITRTAAGWNAQVWSDGTAEDSLDLGTFRRSEYARRSVAQVVIAHVKLADDGDVDMVGGDGDGTFQPYAAPDSISGSPDNDPYSADGAPEPLVAEDGEQQGSPGVQEGTTRTGSAYTYDSLFAVAEAKDGQDDEGPEGEDDGIEEADPDDDDESLDEEIAEDENDDDGDDGQDDEGDDDPEPEQSTDDGDDGGHDEPHRRDDEDGDEGTDNPGDDSDDDGIEKHSSVAELQEKFGLTHLAGANYSLAQQDQLVREGDGKTARNRGDLNLAGTHYEANSAAESPEDTLAFLF